MKKKKYQKKLSLYPMTLEKVVDAVLAFKPKRKKKKPKKPRVKSLRRPGN